MLHFNNLHQLYPAPIQNPSANSTAIEKKPCPLFHKGGPAVALKIMLLQTPRICYFYFSKLPLNLIRTANVFIYILFTMFVVFCPVVLFQSRDLKWFDWAAFGSANTRRGICKLHQITNLYYICLFHRPSL